MNAFLLTALLSLTIQQELSSYEVGIQILKEQGISKGLDYFREQAITKDDATSLFYLGWSLYRDGSIGDAEEIANFILANSENESSLSGSCYYLVGLIASSRGEIKEAKRFINKSLGTFKKHKKHKSEFNALCMMAYLSVNNKYFSEAVEYIRLAEKLKETHAKGQQWNMGYFWELRGRIAFGLGVYQEALDATLKSKEEYEKSGDLIRANHSLSGIAFFQLLTGQVHKGLANTQKVEDIIYETEDDYKVLSYYNGVNWILANKCSEQPYQKLEKELRDYGVQNEDNLLLEHLEFALNWNCD